jgi:hypothetical protein
MSESIINRAFSSHEAAGRTLKEVHGPGASRKWQLTTRSASRLEGVCVVTSVTPPCSTNREQSFKPSSRPNYHPITWKMGRDFIPRPVIKQS